MEVMAQANSVLTNSKYAVMAQLSQMIEKSMQFSHIARPYMQQQQKYQRENITVGSVGEISPIGAKHVLPRNHDTNMRHITIKYLKEEKRGDNVS